VEPITHGLASIAIGRAGLNKFTRAATPILLVSGLIADIDWMTRVGSAEEFLRGHRTATHSLAGTGAILIAVATASWLVGRRFKKFAVGLLPALAICAIGAGAHLFLDLLNAYGVKLFWPFSEKSYAWDLVDGVDWWLLFFLLAGLLVPELFRLMHEEIGAKPKSDGRQRGAIAALALAAFLIGGRAVAHWQAVALLDSRNYRGQTPLAVSAFPNPSNPLLWSGVVETDNMIVSVGVSPVGAFDPEAGDVRFKPEPSTMLKNAAVSHAGAEFLKFARFPLARVQHESDGFVVRIRDMRFAQDATERRGLAAVIHEDAQGVVTEDQIEFDSDVAK
jgi:membrane-bound metal-dependent hydrolase YbcI (DUF457 family)